jgi:hypothetical protein
MNNADLILNDLRDVLRRSIEEDQRLLTSHPNEKDAKRYRGNIKVLREMLADLAEFSLEP